MRIRLTLGRLLLFTAIFLFAVVALLPLRLAIGWLDLDARGLSARDVNGSIWLGSLAEARFGAVPLGDLGTSLRSAPLLLGQARIDLNRDGDTDPFQGSVTLSRHGFGVDDLSTRLATGSLFAPLPVTVFDMGDVTVGFRSGLCTAAEGQVKAMLAGEVGGLALPGGLAGNVRCDGGALLLPLVSQSGLETLDVRLFADGRFETQFSLRPTDPALAERLAAAGFMPLASGAYAVRSNGHL